MIVRENSEGEYSGVGGRAHQGHPIEVATDVSIMTRAGVERIIRKIDVFRKEVLDIVRSDSKESMICELNVQFFPLSKELEKGGSKND